MIEISTVPKKAGVTCPKETGEMDADRSCRLCQHYEKCYSAVLSALGAFAHDLTVIRVL